MINASYQIPERIENEKKLLYSACRNQERYLLMESRKYGVKDTQSGCNNKAVVFFRPQTQTNCTISPISQHKSNFK